MNTEPEHSEDDEPSSEPEALTDLFVYCEERGYDLGVKTEIASECAWSAEVRLTEKPNDPDGPDRSKVTYAVGAIGPAEAIERAVVGMWGWLEDEGLA